ncbi:hypothetical protein DERP_002878 [Dermatophagoides pteronyssinus]|uniref:CD47 immunoglobulin-like domain-containing protein n=1 Tax=Dermatophagoides pteronyssinus TaxID=6956 RepID=A0ABQ8JVZ1_DERPT|nr:hypothetical protein DERP_002878 [Dermatophagoides pteronyssinus]
MVTKSLKRDKRKFLPHQNDLYNTLRSTTLPETKNSFQLGMINNPLMHDVLILACFTSSSSSTSTLISFIMTMFIIIMIMVVSTTQAVRINSISRPKSFRSGTANEVILDCDFSIDDNDEMLVVKWFLNDDSQHIYQWIQSRDYRIYSDLIKPYVDENFFVQDPKTRHRAIRLLNPPAILSGKYTCSVSSLQNEEINSTYLVIYEPARSFEMAAIEDEENDDNDNNDDDGFNITCTAFGLYPEPEIKLLKIKSINETLESYEIESNTTTIISFRSMTNGFYSITLISHIEQNQSSTMISNNNNELNPSRARLSLKSQSSTSTTTTNQIAEHYECRLSIPNTDYYEVKRLAIQDGWRTKWRSNAAASTTTTLSSLTSILSAIFITSDIVK